MTDKSKKRSDLAANVILFTIGNIGSKLVSFLMIPLYTAVLSVSEYGVVDLIMTLASLLIPVLTVSVQDAVLRYALDSECNQSGVLNVGLRVIAIASMALFIILLVIAMTGVAPLQQEYLAFLFISFLTGSLYNVLNMYLKAKNLVNVIVISGIFSAAITCILGLFTLLYVNAGVIGYMFALAAGSASGVVYMFVSGRLYRELTVKSFPGLGRAMLSYSAPLIANSLAWWVNSASDRYILTFFCGVAANGLYSVAGKIPTILATLQGVFYNAWSISAISEFDPEDNDGFMGEMYSFYSCGTFAACSIIMLANIPLASILYSGDFFEAWQYAPMLLVGAAFNGLALFEGCIFTAVRKTADVSKTTIIGAIVNTIFNVLFIISFGAIGAAAATMLGFIAVWIMRTILMKKFVTLKVNWRLQIISGAIIVAQSLIASFSGTFLLQLCLFVILCVLQRQYLVAVVDVFFNRIRKIRSK